MQGYFETGLPAAEGADRGVHRAVPEREVEHPRGSVRRHHAERTARDVRADNPPDLMRLPQLAGLVKEAC